MDKKTIDEIIGAMKIVEKHGRCPICLFLDREHSIKLLDPVPGRDISTTFECNTCGYIAGVDSVISCRDISENVYTNGAN